MNLKTNKNYLYHRLVNVEARANVCIRMHGYEFLLVERRYNGPKRDMGLVYCIMKQEQKREIRIPITWGWNYTLCSEIRALHWRFQSDGFEEAYQLLCGRKNMRFNGQ